MRIVCASSSPRRRAILGSLFDSIEFLSPDVEEIVLPDENPIDHACRLALLKASSIASKIDAPDYLVIGSDTIVTYDTTILGKPKSFDHAQEMLAALQGRVHYVMTAVSLMYKAESKSNQLTWCDKSEVTFKDLSNADIRDYLNSIEYRDKAGAYAIQENGDKIISSVNGSQTNIIGFPLGLFYSMLSEIELLHLFFK